MNKDKLGEKEDRQKRGHASMVTPDHCEGALSTSASLPLAPFLSPLTLHPQSPLQVNPDHVVVARYSRQGYLVWPTECCVGEIFIK